MYATAAGIFIIIIYMTTQSLKESKYKDWAYARTDTSTHTTGPPAPHYSGPNALTTINTSTLQKVQQAKTHQIHIKHMSLQQGYITKPSKLHHSVTLSLNFTYIKATIKILNSKHYMVSDPNRTSAHSVSPQK